MSRHRYLAAFLVVFLFLTSLSGSSFAEPETGPAETDAAESVPETEAYSEEELSDLEYADEFGYDAVVVRDEENRAVTVNGYPCKYVTAGLSVRSSDEAFQYVIPFVDYPFWRPADNYDGNLAVMSLAMALSADRALNLQQEPDDLFDPSKNVEDFFLDAGFTDIRKDDYSKETSMYTVSTAMARQTMEQDGEEPFTLIAVGVCGAYYKNEWQSNMTPGDGDVHEGFQSAANLVTDRIAGYIMTEGITGRIKVWISGFSRAAAVSNLVAATLVQKGVFPKEDVYAYTFATPAAVKDPPETGFENIFNIINPMDLVPQVMPRDWGFGRYGKDLFLPVTEFSTLLGNYIVAQRAEISREVLRLETTYSPALNLRTRLMLSMLLELIETREDYNKYFQPVLVGIMQNKNVSYILNSLRSLLENLKDADRETIADLDDLLDYVMRVFENVLTRHGLAEADSNSGKAFLRLLGEHREDSYLMNVETLRLGIFEENQTFSYILVRGPVDISLYWDSEEENAGEKESLQSIENEENLQMVLTKEGELKYGAAIERLQKNNYGESSPYYMERVGNVSIVALPGNDESRIYWKARENGTVEILQADCSVYASALYPGAFTDPVNVKAGDFGLAYSASEGTSSLPEGSKEYVFGAVDLASFIGIASFHIHWRTGVMLTTGLLGILTAFIICLILKRGRRGRKYGILTWLYLGIFCIAAMETEAAYWFLADAVIFRVLWKAVVGISLILLFFRLHLPKKPLRETLFPGLVLAIIADIVICYAAIPGAVLFFAGHVLLIICFLRRVPMRRAKWLQWAVVSLVFVVIVIWRFVPLVGSIALAASAYASMLFLMAFTAAVQPLRIRYAARMFVCSDILLGLFFTVFHDPAVHVIYMMLFYLALLLMAIGKEAGKR